MAPAAVWSVERVGELGLDSEHVRLLAGIGVLAANFVLLMLPPAIAALVLMGAVR